MYSTLLSLAIKLQKKSYRLQQNLWEGVDFTDVQKKQDLTFSYKCILVYTLFPSRMKNKLIKAFLKKRASLLNKEARLPTLTDIEIKKLPKGFLNVQLNYAHMQTYP